MGDWALAKELEAKGIHDRRVLDAIAALDRRDFVPASERGVASRDEALSIGWKQTISQPFVVAFMTQALELRGDERVFEVGTGSGYQAAVLAQLAAEVYSVEIVGPLFLQAEERLARWRNVHVAIGNGREGWPTAAPFDAILITAAAAEVPVPLLQQLRPDGVLVAPLGPVDAQDIVRVWRRPDGALQAERLMPVRFVPLVEGDSGVNA
jgi:protein-L-isoaspartate(D-aspartate) O-methyltransferase